MNHETRQAIQNVKTITVDIADLLMPLNALKKKQKRVSITTDYNSKTMYITDTNTCVSIKGF